MGKHADPDSRPFYRSLASAAIRAAMVAGALLAVVIAVGVVTLERSAGDGAELDPASAAQADGAPRDATEADTKVGADPDPGEADPDPGEADPDQGEADPDQGESDPTASDAVDASGEEPGDDSGSTEPAEPTEYVEATAAPTADPGEGEESEVAEPAALPPSEVTVQVMDGIGDPRAAGQVAARLEELGYRVVARNRASRHYERTTILFSQGSEAEAEALRALDPAFGELGPNPNLSQAVNLHVVVGADWSG